MYETLSLIPHLVPTQPICLRQLQLSADSQWPTAIGDVYQACSIQAMSQLLLNHC